MLLGLAGAILGGFALWQTDGLGIRLDQVQQDGGTADAGPDRRELDQQYSRELKRLDEELAQLGAAVAESREFPRAEVEADLAGLKDQLARLSDQLQDFRRVAMAGEGSSDQQDPELAAIDAASPAPDTSSPGQSAAPVETPALVESAALAESTAPVESALPTEPSAPVESAEPAEPSAPADPSQTVATQTPNEEPPPRSTGPSWSVNLLAFQKRERAESELRRLRSKDIDAQIRSVDVNGTNWYRILVGGFTNFAQAKSYAEEVRTEPGLAAAWIGRE
jgi:cell division septation protein DedD